MGTSLGAYVSTQHIFGARVEISMARVEVESTAEGYQLDLTLNNYTPELKVN